MGNGTIEKLTRDEANAQRKTLLDNIGMTFDEVRNRADDYSLTPEEMSAWRRIEDLTWLLGE
jgi:hypothetical protein